MNILCTKKWDESGKVWGEGENVWGLVFVFCCLKGSISSISSRGCMKVEEYKRFATSDNSHGSPLTWERGWACLPVGMGEVIEKNTK